MGRMDNPDPPPPEPGTPQPDDLQARLDALQAELDQTKAELETEKSASAQARADLETARAELEQAKADLAAAQGDLEAKASELATLTAAQKSADAIAAEKLAALGHPGGVTQPAESGKMTREEFLALTTAEREEMRVRKPEEYRRLTSPQ